MTQKIHIRGFALLITISLIAFLVLIVVALSSFTRVETSVADNSQQLNQARQQALNALNLAVGQLQTHAGPDRTVTARAEITSAGSLNQPYLTGAWKTTNTTGVPDAWFVSGNETNPLAITPSTAPSPSAGVYPVDDTANQVFLLGDNSVDDPAQRVRVAKRDVTAPAGSIPGLTAAAVVGHYAYWIGDEGIKTSASMVDPLLSASAIAYDNAGAEPGDNWAAAGTKKARLNQLQLPRPRLESLFGSFDPDSAAAVSELPRIQSLRQLEAITNAPSAAGVRASFHAVTPLSEAVLVDTINGRLRRDLSNPNGASNVGAAVRAYRDFRVGTPATGFVADYTASGLTPSTATTFPAFSAAPVLSEFGLRFWFSLGGASGTEIILNYIVEAELWNPYAARFTMVTGQPLSLDVGDLNITVNTTGGGSHTVNVGSLVTTAGIVVDTAEAWAAGEIKTVSGTTTLTAGGGQGTLGTGIEATGATGIPSVDLPALSPQSRIELHVNQPTRALIQSYEPAINHVAAAGVANNESAFSFGYGFNFKDEVAYWTSVNGSGQGNDPRSPLLNADYHDATWDNGAGVNAGVSPDGAVAGLTTIVLFDLPRQELVSIGALRNLVGDTPADLGNAWGAATNAWFDQYYLSTVPRNHAWDFAGGEPLPNRYLRYYAPEGAAAPALADLRDEQNSSRYLLQHGAFNLNSTSVAAWKAVLGARINNWQLEGAAGTQILDNTVLRLTHGAQQLANAPLPNTTASTLPIADANTVTTGGRQLTATEVDALATAIVAELRTRGRPFASIRDLLNDGLLTRAINTANINDTTKLAADFAHAPAAVTQADLAALLAPFATVRSDTFLVRAYGDARNPVSGQIQGRAWCEAVVQRVPETVDASDNPITPTGTFGRKFKIISFRWLTSDDI